MLFVTLGTQKFQLNRLLEELDWLVAEGIITDEVFAQTGYSTYKPRNFDSRDFISRVGFNDKIEQCDLVICHGGVGSILAAIKKNKPTIVCPRKAELGEHVDDHQFEIAGVFDKLGCILVCNEVHELGTLIKDSKSYQFSPYHTRGNEIVETIDEFLDSLK